MSTPKPAPRRSSRVTFSDELRDRIESCGESPHALAVRAGVNPAVVSRFLTGVRPSLTTVTVNRLADALGLHLTGGNPRPRTRPAAKSKSKHCNASKNSG